jgi:DNA replication protein DnaC
MTRPAKITDHEYFMLAPDQRRAYDAERAAWWQTPEGLAERAEREARERARYEALLPAAIERVLRDRCENAWEGQELPARALDVVLAGPQETVAVQAARGATDILVLLSPPGPGKTVAAVEWVREHVARPENWQPKTDYDDNARRTIPHFVGKRPIWTTAAALARLDHFSDAALRPYFKAQRLVIDDLGAEYLDAKGFFGSLFDELIDARYAAKLPTIITSNLDAAAFASRYGLRVVDRILEGGRFVGCGNVSLRGKAST